MAKLNTLVYEIIEDLNEYSDDSLVSERYIQHLINIYRNKYIHQAYARKQVLELVNRQTANIMLELVDSSKGNIRVNSKILRSEDKIPKLLSLGRRPAVSSITSIDMLDSGDFDFMSKDRAAKVGACKFAGNAVFLNTDQRLYFTSTILAHIGVEEVLLDGIYEDPRDVLEPGETVATMEYPVDMGIWPNIKVDIVSFLLKKINTPYDMENQSTFPQISVDPKADNRQGSASIYPKVQ